MVEGFFQEKSRRESGIGRDIPSESGGKLWTHSERRELDGHIVRGNSGTFQSEGDRTSWNEGEHRGTL